jgi:hypothetical protein
MIATALGRGVLALGVVAMALGAGHGASAGNASRPNTLQVPRHPKVTGAFTISYLPARTLPSGGYYYAVAVVNKTDAVHFDTEHCAKESLMTDTEYGYPKARARLRLRIAPERGPAGPSLRWCTGATYIGAVYAVPHPPPCSRGEPCYGRPGGTPECYPGERRPGPRFYCREGKVQYIPVKGIVRPRKGGGGTLPAPLDASAHIVARFHLTIGSPHLVRVTVPRHPAAQGNVTIGFFPPEDLPSTGYYYAALVLPAQRNRTSERCSRESTMSEGSTYSYLKPHHLFIRLTMTQREAPFRWCSGATYQGALYAAPDPPCPDHQRACPTVPSIDRLITHLRIRPGHVPQPRDDTTYVIARFTVSFR